MNRIRVLERQFRTASEELAQLDRTDTFQVEFKEHMINVHMKTYAILFHSTLSLARFLLLWVGLDAPSRNAPLEVCINDHNTIVHM